MSGREGEDGDIACEVYVTGPKDSFEYIDYTLLMGDTSAIFDAMFPPETKPQEEGTEEVMEEPQEPENMDENGGTEAFEEPAATE